MHNSILNLLPRLKINPVEKPTWYCRKSFSIKKNWFVKFREAKHRSAVAGSYGNHPLGQAHSKIVLFASGLSHKIWLISF